MKYRYVFLLLGILFLYACSNDGGAQLEKNEPLHVELTVPETADVDETFEMAAYVTQGDEEVNDADEVVFEVWEEGNREDGQMIEADDPVDGLYRSDISFGHDGNFHIQVHVTARGLHIMPQKEVIIGEGGQYEDVEDTAHFHTDGFDMHFTNLTDVTVDEEVQLTTFIELHNEPLDQLKVRYEIWNEDVSDDRDWVDANEQQHGEYVGTHTFEHSGTYMIQVHVEDDEQLHEHKTYEVEVK